MMWRTQEGFSTPPLNDPTQVYSLKYTLDANHYDGKTLYCNFLTHPTYDVHPCIRSIPNQPFGKAPIYWLNTNEGTDKNDTYYKITKASNLKNYAGDTDKWVIWAYWK
jgi:hypothetical protein